MLGRGGGEGIGDHLKWAGGRWGGREGILGNAYYWDLRRGGERADAEIEPWAPNLNHSYWSKLTIEGRDMGGGGIRAAEALDWLAMLGGGKGGRGGSGSTIVIGWRRIPPFFSLSQEKKLRDRI